MNFSHDTLKSLSLEYKYAPSTCSCPLGQKVENIREYYILVVDSLDTRHFFSDGLIYYDCVSLISHISARCLAEFGEKKLVVPLEYSILEPISYPLNK